LKGIKKTSCLITDLGLCKPVNELSKEDKIFGVMPYVAPEVLRSQPYTQKADIYSFGIIAYEVLSGLPPYL
jgi:serine/threonine protein kinase